MTLLLVFAAALIVAVLLSERASRSVLSISVLFLVLGVATGPSGLGWVELDTTDPGIELLVELALFSVLFTDGMRVGVRELAKAWRLPGRALVFGMPLTALGTMVLAHWLLDLSWTDSLLLGAGLAPTDPVFAAAIVGQEGVPRRVRQLLNVESGLNDGLALPIVLVLLAVSVRADVEAARLLGEVVLGVVIGVAVPWLVLRLESSRAFRAHAVYEPLLGFSIALAIYAIAAATHANEFLAAFAAGITVASISEAARDDFHHFGEIVTELLKLAALLAFGVLIEPTTFADFGVASWVFVALVLVVVRPLAVVLALWGSEMDAKETAVAAWFGPKGFASVLYGLLILESGIASGDALFHAVAAVVAASIVLHSSTDVFVARWLQRTAPSAGEREPTEQGPARD